MKGGHQTLIAGSLLIASKRKGPSLGPVLLQRVPSRDIQAYRTKKRLHRERWWHLGLDRIGGHLWGREHDQGQHKICSIK